jgi:hypothetical protein
MAVYQQSATIPLLADELTQRLVIGTPNLFRLLTGSGPWSVAGAGGSQASENEPHFNLLPSQKKRRKLDVAVCTVASSPDYSHNPFTQSATNKRMNSRSCGGHGRASAIG